MYSTATVSSLANNEIDGSTLLTMTPKLLREEVGVKALKERQRLHSDIQVLTGVLLTLNFSNSKQYQECKQMLGEVYEDESKMSSDESMVIVLQENEVFLYEQRVQDHNKSIDAQRYYNSLMFLEEKDAGVAQKVDNIDDRAATRRMQQASTIEDESEARRIRENEEIIREASEADANLAANRLLLTGFSVSGGSSRPGSAEKYEANDNLDPQGWMQICHPTEDHGPKSGTKRDCVACLNSCKKQSSVTALCGHNYCHSCLRDLFETALLDTSLLPLQCCKLPLENVEELAATLLKPAQVSRLLSATEERELDFDEKMYCPNEVRDVLCKIAILIVRSFTPLTTIFCYTT
jgi:hypothetical protein